jgi:hypothetical protein
VHGTGDLLCQRRVAGRPGPCCGEGVRLPVTGRFRIRGSAPPGVSPGGVAGVLAGHFLAPTSKEETVLIPKQLILDELRNAGRNEHVERAVQELPEKIDHNEHAALLEKFGLDPGKLAEKAVRRELGEK